MCNLYTHYFIISKQIDHLPLISLDEIRSFFQLYALSLKESQRRKLSMQVSHESKSCYYNLFLQLVCLSIDSQVIGNDIDYRLSVDHNQKDEIKLRFLTENDDIGSFIQDLNELRQSSVIFPPLKTFNGLPTIDLAH